VKFKFLPVLTLLLAAWFFLTNSMLNPSNPPTAKTGAPGESTCSTTSGCHNGGTFIGTVSISGVPDTVVPGQIYTIVLTNSSNAVRAGFELTCWDEINAMCGTLTAGSGVSIGSGSAGKKYARQSTPKTLSGGNTSWSFTWKAPTTASGNKITFYYASLCANGDGGKSGDIAITGNKSVVLQATSAAIEPAKEADIKFYPTLVQQNNIHIELLEAQSGQIRVFDLNGKIVLDKTISAVYNLNVSDLPKGIFTAHLIANGKTATRKFVVE
jgi:hypothetical protein